MPRSLSIRSAGCGIVGLLLLAILGGDARADWPGARHDAQRTGAATGVSNVRTPGAYWRAYLGGRLGLTQAMPLTIDGTGVIVYVASGRVTATRPDGVRLWTSENLAVLALVAATDLDGDGRLEVVAQSDLQVFAFDAATGVLRWQEEETDLGAIGAVRVTDLDGDGLDDVLIEACTCCRVASHDNGYVFSFREGFATPRRLWQLPFAFCAGRQSLLADDVDGDGSPDVLLGDWADLKLLDGRTGALLATSPDLGTWVGASTCEAIDLDDSPGKEIICVHGTALETADAGHRVFALHYQADPPQLGLMWTRDVGTVNGAIGVAADFLRDLDGDGAIELTVTGFLSDGTPQTVVLDASTGDQLASLEGEAVVGTTVRSDGPVLLTQVDDRLSAWTFVRGQPLAHAWAITNRRAMLTRDWTRAARQPLSSEVLVGDVDLDGAPDVFTVNTKVLAEMPVHALSSPTGASVGIYRDAEDAEVLVGWPVDGGEVIVSSSNGRLTDVSSTLATLSSVRAGGYYADGGWGNLAQSPVAADLDNDGSAEVLITDSRSALLALDVHAASNAAPPAKMWERPLSSAPAIVPDLGASATTGIACRRSDPESIPPVELVVAVNGDGSLRWQTPVGAKIFNDILAGNFDGDAIPDVVVQWGRPDDTAVRTMALSGLDGHPLWTTVTEAGVTRFPAGAAIVDWNHDGLDDVVFHHYGTRVLSGLDGSEIGFGGPLVPYFMATPLDVTGDGVPEVTLHGGFSPTETLASDLSTSLWKSTEDERPYPYAAFTTCGSVPVMIGGSLAHPARLKVTLQSGTPGAWQAVVLSDGAVYLDEDTALAAGAPVSNQLTSVYVHDDLTGLGHPSAVVGSADGWLYAVNPCDLTLDFAMKFDVPVGAVAFADGDGDGLDEILVSTADGFLHGVKQAPLQGPIEVRDVDPAGGDVDIDELVTRGTLAAAWDPVPGASGYEVTVAREEGGIIATPPWQRLGSTYVTFVDLPLEDGARYIVSVRAVSAAGVSPDTLSDGVLVHLLPAPPDGGVEPEPPPGVPGGCCSASTTGPGGPLGFSLVVAIGLLARRRRR